MYSKKLNPEHSLRKTRGIKRTRQKVIIMHNPSEIDHNQLGLIRFSNLGSDDIIISITVNLSFDIELSSMADSKRALASNIDRAIVKKLVASSKGTRYWVCMISTKICERQHWKSRTQ